MITDEMVEKARKAYHDNWEDRGLRAALEAVAPLLIAQGMREAIHVYQSGRDWEYDGRAYMAILARAQELDPK